MMNKKSLALLCTLAVMGSAYSVSAEEQKNVGNFALDEVVVTATRSEQSLLNTSANVSIVTAEEIERMHYDNLEDTLRTMTGIQFLDYNLPGYAMDKVRINGSEQVVVLINGVRVSSTASGIQYPFDYVSDMDNIERIEVLKGAAAVLYGSDAKGGVINIITKKDVANRTKVTVEGGDFGHETYKINTEGRVDATSYRVYGQKAITDDFEDGSGVEWDTHSNSENTGVMLRHEFEEGSDIVFNYNHSDSDFSFSDPLYDQENAGYLKTKNMQIVYNQQIDDTLVNTLSYNNHRNEYVNELWPKSNNSFKDTVISDTLTKTFGDTHIVTLGYEKTKTRTLGNRRFETGFFPLPDVPDLYEGVYFDYSAVVENEAFYMQDEWKIDDKWTLISGVRYDDPENLTDGGKPRYEWDDSIVDDETIAGSNLYFPETDLDSNVSKSFNLTYKFDEATNMYVAYNDYFILPSVYQLYNEEHGNIKLLPEQGKNYEVGVNHMLDDRTLLTVHAFQRDSDQNIGYDSDAEVYVNDKEKSRGWDITLDRRFDDNWSANIGYARLHHRSSMNIMGDNADMGYLPKNSLTAGINYTDAKWDVGMDMRGFIGRDGTSIKHEVKGWPSDRYLVFNLSANYAADDHVKVFARCNNLFDKTYAEHTAVIHKLNPEEHAGEWYGAPGRNFVVGVEYSF